MQKDGQPVPTLKLWPYSLQSVSLGCVSGLEVHICALWGKLNLEKRFTETLEVGLGPFGQGTLGCWIPERSLEGEGIDSSWTCFWLYRLLILLERNTALRIEEVPLKCEIQNRSPFLPSSKDSTMA